MVVGLKMGFSACFREKNKDSVSIGFLTVFVPSSYSPDLNSDGLFTIASEPLHFETASCVTCIAVLRTTSLLQALG